MAYENEKGVMTPNRMQHLKGGMQRIDIDIDHCLNLLLTEVVAGNHDPSTRVDTAKLQVELGGIKVELRDIDIRDTDHYDDTRQQINEINGHLQEVKTQLIDYAVRHGWNILPDVPILKYMTSDELYPGV